MKHHPIAAAALLTLLALATAATAQTASDGKLQVVTVTAERRLENIRDVPNSVSVLAGEALEILNSSGEDVRQLAGRLPSLNIESSFGRAFPRFYIRGLGNTDFDLNASQPVSMVFDDVVQENPILKGFPMFDLERVEVLRGPQGTLFGRNSPAGVIKFESVKPGKKFEGYGAVSVGRYSMLNVEGAVNVPLSADAAMRISLQSQNRDDWVTNTFAAGPVKEFEGYNDHAARIQFSIAPTKDFSALLNLHGRKLDGSARLFRANIIKPRTNELVDGFDPTKVSYDGVNQQNLTSSGGSLKLRWLIPGTPGLALTSITGYETVEVLSRGDIDGGFGAVFLGPGNSGPGLIPFDAESADGLPKHRQFTQEFRVESTAPGPFSWIGGLYFFDEQIDIDSINYSTLGGGVRNGYATQNQDNKAYAVFGSVNYEVSPSLRLRGGLRWTKDKKDFFADRIQAPPFSPTFIGRRTAITDASNTSFDASATWVLSKDVNVYVRAATGFRAPSIQGRLLFGDTLSVAKSETVRSLEAGVKADLLDRRARVAATVFGFNMKNQQLTAVGGTANFNQLVNAAKTTGQGFELDLQLLATDRLLITANASYNKTQIKDPNLFIATCGGGCTPTDPAGPVAGTVSINGNPLPQSPKTVLNLGARYSIPLPGGEAYLATDWSYRGKMNFLLYEALEYTGKSLLVGGVRAAYLFGGGKYEAAAFVRNVADRVQNIYTIDFNNLTGVINEPRTYGVSFKATF